MQDLFLTKKTILQIENTSTDKYPITAWKVKALKIMEWKRDGWSGALDWRVSRGSRLRAWNSLGFETDLLFWCFYFSLSFLRVSWNVLFFRRKICWQRMLANCTSFSPSPSPQWTLPSTYTTYCHLIRGAKKINRCGGIDKVLLKGPKFKVKFGKTKKASLIRDVQRLIFSFPACNRPTINIYIRLG